MDSIQKKISDYEYEAAQRKYAFAEKNARMFEEHPMLFKIKKSIDELWIANLKGEISFAEASEKADALDLKFKKYLSDNNIPERLSKYEPKCARCGDSGYVAGRMCACLKQYVWGSGVLHERSCGGFDSYDPKLYSDEDNVSKAEKAYEKCSEFARTFEKTGNWLLMSGKPGSGKTFFAGCIAREVERRGFTVLFTTSYNLIEKFTPSYTQGEDDKTFINAVFSCDLLVIDDLGTERKTDFSERILFNVLNERYNRKKAVVFTTNYSVNEIYSYYGERLVSRIVGCTSGVNMPEDDIRVKMKFLKETT